MNTGKQVTFIFLFLGLFLQGTEAQEKLTLDLKAAQAYALQFNKNIINSGLAIDQSGAKLRETIAAGLPQVNAATDYNNAMGAKIKIQFEENAPVTEIPIKPTSNFNLQVGQLIFSGNYLVGIQTARLAQKLSGKDRVKTEQEIVSQVTENYYLVQVSRESLQILESNRDNLLDIYRKTEPMVRVGVLEKIELDQLSVQLNALENAVKAAERQYETAKNMLRVQLGVEAVTEIELTQTMEQLLRSNHPGNAVNDLFEPANNIDFQLITVQEELAEKQIDMEKAGYLPTLSGYYAYTYKILKPDFDMSPKHMAGFQMNIPIFSGGERRSKVRHAKIGLETTRNSKSMLEDQLIIQFKQLQFNLKNALENYENQQKNVATSREVYHHLNLKFSQGLISGLDLITANNNYLKAESDFLTARFEVLQAQNELNTLTGKILNN